jgi:hypothetical protein
MQAWVSKLTLATLNFVPQGYGAVYEGMLVSEHEGHNKGEYLCMTKSPEATGSSSNENGVRGSCPRHSPHFRSNGLQGGPTGCSILAFSVPPLLPVSSFPPSECYEKRAISTTLLCSASSRLQALFYLVEAREPRPHNYQTNYEQPCVMCGRCPANHFSNLQYSACTPFKSCGSGAYAVRDATLTSDRVCL